MPKYFLDMDFHSSALASPVFGTGAGPPTPPGANPIHKEHVFIASDGAVMRSKRRLNPSGWQLDNFHRNPVVLENHSWESLPIGKARAWVDGQRLYAGITFARSARGQEIEQLVEDGILRAVSVGWLPAGADARPVTDGSKLISIDFAAQELVEISIVTIPDNANAIKVAAARDFDGQEIIDALRAATAALKEALLSGNRRS